MHAWKWKVKVKSLSRVRLLVTPWTAAQNSGVGSLFLLQGIFPTQGSNTGLPHCRWILYRQRTREQRVNFRSCQERFSLGSVLVFTPPTSMRFWYVCTLSWIQLFVTPRTVAHQAHLSMRFPRQEYWSGLTFPPLGDLPHPGINSHLLHCRWILYLLSHWGSPSID